MKLEHIAIAVTNPSEIEIFYKGLLGMEEVRSFILNEKLSQKIFSIPKETPVTLLQKDDLVLEIFLLDEPLKKGYNHICIAVDEREKLVKAAARKKFEVAKIERELSDLIFIKDHSGNIFEVKEK
jgi:catechol 2,3-dioxygenase-like lactoylglutathione lyase family enzyme